MNRVSSQPQGLSAEEGGRSVFWFAVAVIMVLHIIAGAKMWGYTVDDAYIFFRYAEHTAQGYGPTFNFDGDAPVEGYTSPLWMFLLAGTYFISHNLEVNAKILGLALNLGTIVALASFVLRHFRQDKFFVGALFGILWSATCFPFAVSSIEGLETPLANFLTMVTLTAVFSTFQSRRTWVALSLLQIGLYLTRPDMLLGVAGVALLWIFGVLPNDSRDRRSRCWQGLACYGLLICVIVLHVVWRHHYYGHWLPCTFYAKAGGTTHHFAFGLNRINTFFLGQTRTDVLFVLQPFVLTLALARQGSMAIKPYAALLLFVVARVCFHLYSGGEIMGVSRFLTPAIPVLGALWVWSLIQITESIETFPRRPRWYLRPDTVFLLLLACAFVFLQFRKVGSLGSQINLPHHKAVGRWLCQNARPNWLVANGDVGVVFYLAKHVRVLDILGLNDYHIAQLPGQWIPTQNSPKVDVDYVLGKRPEVVILRLAKDTHDRTAMEAGIARSERFRKEYRFVENHSWLYIYLRSDLSPHASLMSPPADLAEKDLRQIR